MNNQKLTLTLDAIIESQTKDTIKPIRLVEFGRNCPCRSNGLIIHDNTSNSDSFGINIPSNAISTAITTFKCNPFL